MASSQTGFAVALSQTRPDQWVWRVLNSEGDETAAGESGREDVAREHAEFLRRSLIRLSQRW